MCGMAVDAVSTDELLGQLKREDVARLVDTVKSLSSDRYLYSPGYFPTEGSLGPQRSLLCSPIRSLSHILAGPSPRIASRSIQTSLHDRSSRIRMLYRSQKPFRKSKL